MPPQVINLEACTSLGGSIPKATGCGYVAGLHHTPSLFLSLIIHYIDQNARGSSQKGVIFSKVLEVFLIAVSRCGVRTYVRRRGAFSLSPLVIRVYVDCEKEKRSGGLHYIGVLSDTGSETTSTTYSATSPQHERLAVL